MLTHAIARKPGANFGDGLTSTPLAEPPSVELALEQHGRYVEALRESGLEVILLDADPAHPDAAFVEDAAVVTPEVAVATRPGAASRRGEVLRVAEALESFRPLERIRPPGTLDGGDVLIAGREAFIGLSGRTNPEGAGQLGAILESRGYRWTALPVGAGLHLKSGVNQLGPGILLMTGEFADCAAFREYERVVVDPIESYAANCLRLNDRIIAPRGYPVALKALERLGIPIVELEMSEFRKMDGGVTCLSIRF